MGLMLQVLVLLAWQQTSHPLPRVLLIGDSISIGYTAAVREILRFDAERSSSPSTGSEFYPRSPAREKAGATRMPRDGR
jgi:hypothetical protein